LARGEHERASTALGDVRAALTDGSLDAPSDASSIMKPISESSFAKSSTALGDLRAKDRARSLTSAADSLHDAIQTDLTARLERSFAVDKDTGQCRFGSNSVRVRVVTFIKCIKRRRRRFNRRVDRVRRV
jgi:hypothetical protein